MRSAILSVVLWFVVCGGSGLFTRAADAGPESDWRELPLITDGKLDPNWVQIKWGGFVVEEDCLSTQCDEKGMGLLLYRPERFGDCQIRIVYKCQNAKCNAGVFVRIDDGILEWIDRVPPAAQRDSDGGLAPGALEALMEASQREQGSWYAVHHGYEVQIRDDADEYHRTGAIYSLAKAAAAPPKRLDEWKTMVITLQGSLVQVEIDGRLTTSFEPDSPDVPADRKWFELKREPKRPTTGFIGLQNHDPGDVVYFKEVSVRPLSIAAR